MKKLLIFIVVTFFIVVQAGNIYGENDDDKVFKKEFWCNGKEAIDFGLSDGLPGNKLTNF